MARREPVNVNKEETSTAQEKVSEASVVKANIEPKVDEKKKAPAAKSKNGGCLI